MLCNELCKYMFCYVYLDILNNIVTMYDEYLLFFTHIPVAM